jgi:hypothetical protein
VIRSGVALTEGGRTGGVRGRDAGEHRDPNAPVDRGPVLAVDQLGYIEARIGDPATAPAFSILLSG